MSMYALLRNNPTPRMADVEEAFHGTAWLDRGHTRIIHVRTNNSDLILLVLFVCQEICVVAPDTDPYWRDTRLSLW